MNVELTLLVVACGLSATNLVLGVVRTYYARKMWVGSKMYWMSWKERSKDIREEARGD